MSNQLTINNLKTWAKSHTTEALAVVALQAAAEVTLEKVDSYADAPLLKYGFMSQYGGGIIMKRDDLYKTKADCTEYYAELDELHRQHGFSVKPGYCPALVAQTAQIEAENALIASFSKATGFPQWRCIEDRRKILKMILEMAVAEAAKEVAA